MKQTFLSFLLMLLPMLASAETIEIGGIWYNLVAKIKEAEVTKNPNEQYSGGYSGSIEIPAYVTYEGKPYSVTSIGDIAFSNCNGLTSVTIPNSVTSIGYSAFSGCSGLTSVTIPNSVTTIGQSAFQGCRGLTSITIGNNVTSILKSVFYRCSSLTSVTIPNSVTSIGHEAFYCCSNLLSVIIPNSVTSIGYNAFTGCTSLTSIVIPSSVKSIETSVFSECSSLTSVTIPNSVTSIGSDAFYGCSGLTSVTIPNSVTSIGDAAFYGCKGLTSITIPNSVTDIGGEAFANCDDLTDVYCMVEKLRREDNEGLYTRPNAFNDSYPQAMTLHVPAVAIEAYKGIEPWSSFKSFVPIGEGEIPETPKCATPTISLVNGEIIFGCETEGAEFVSEVTVSDAKAYYDNKVSAPKKFKVKVHATKSGYNDSDEVTEEFDFSGDTSRSGDVDGNGVVNVADHVELSNIILNQQGSE